MLNEMKACRRYMVLKKKKKKKKKMISANEYARALLSLAKQSYLSQSVRWIHASDREFRMIPGLLIHDVFIRVALHPSK